MRKIVAGLFVSLDGVVEAPEEWTGPYFTDDVGAAIGQEMAQADTLLIGRSTYETFAASFSGQSGGVADQMNNIPKLVVSTTLPAATWQNSTIVRALAELTAYKEGLGRNIAISGSATLVRSLLDEGLLDELQLLVFPTVVGTGARLFDGGATPAALNTFNTHTYSGGVVRLDYRPKR